MSYCKKQGWLIGGGRDHRDQYQLYNLNPNNLSWKEPVASIGEELEKHQLEHMVNMQTQQIDELEDKVECLLNWSSSSDTNGANVALSSLVRIVGGGSASTRQRIKAAAAILNYRTQQSDIAEFVKKYLQSVCESTDNVDYRIEAGELLRRHEAPRVTPDSVRPSYRDDGAEPREPPVPLLELVRQRRERADRMQAEMIRQYGWRNNSSSGNDSDESSD